VETATEKKKAPRERGEGGLFRLGNSKAWYTKVLGKRESTGTKVKEEAKKILAARMGRAVLGLPDPTALRNVKYEEARERLLADYRQKAHSSLKTLKNGKVTIDGLPYVDKFFGGRSLVHIDRAMLDKFVEQRQRDGASNAYINRNLALLHRAMKLLSEDKNGCAIRSQVSQTQRGEGAARILRARTICEIARHAPGTIEDLRSILVHCWMPLW
jgi:hypothetical protein